MDLKTGVDVTNVTATNLSFIVGNLNKDFEHKAVFSDSVIRITRAGGGIRLSVTDLSFRFAIITCANSVIPWVLTKDCVVKCASGTTCNNYYVKS